MDQKYTIQTEEDDAKGALFIESNGKRIAELLWNKEDDGIIEAHHTFTDESLRGQGVAGRLVENLVNMAQDRKLRIRATCPYVKSVMMRSDEDQKLLV